MLARFGVGAGVAAIPAAAAITGAAAGWACGVVVGFAVLALLAVVVTVAPFVWGLHRLPLIGSPRFDVVLRMNGQLLDGSHVLIHDWANTSILEVGVKTRSRAVTVRDAWMNFLVPSGIRMERCDKVGVAVDDPGHWEPFHRHQLGDHSRCDYWNARGWEFEYGLSHVLRFKVRFPPKAREYPVLFKLGAPGLFRTVEIEGTIVVEVTDDPAADLSPEDEMGALITKGEQVARRMAASDNPFADTDIRVEASAFVAGASLALNPVLRDDQLPQMPSSADEQGIEVAVRDALDALYVVRDDLGRGDLSVPVRGSTAGVGRVAKRGR